MTANIDAIERDDVEILVSDRTGLDDALEVLAARYESDRRVTTLCAVDGADWVRHCNSLLRRPAPPPAGCPTTTTSRPAG